MSRVDEAIERALRVVPAEPAMTFTDRVFSRGDRLRKITPDDYIHKIPWDPELIGHEYIGPFRATREGVILWAVVPLDPLIHSVRWVREGGTAR